MDLGLVITKVTFTFSYHVQSIGIAYNRISFNIFGMCSPKTELFEKVIMYNLLESPIIGFPLTFSACSPKTELFEKVIMYNLLESPIIGFPLTFLACALQKVSFLRIPGNPGHALMAGCSLTGQII